MSSLPGDGTQESPYELRCVEDLDRVRNDLSACYVLQNDITIPKREFFEPIGSSNTWFTGVFDGNNNEIRNLTIKSQMKYGGLFRIIDNGTVKDLELSNVETKKGGLKYTGSVCGEAKNGSMICNVRVSGKVEDDETIGGIVGINYGRVEDCYVSGSTMGNKYVGGIGGVNYASKVLGCYVWGSVIGEEYVGSITGDNIDGLLRDCYIFSHTKGEWTVGGVTGNNTQAEVEKCLVIGSVKNDDSTTTEVTGKSNGKVENSSVIGRVKGSDVVEDSIFDVVVVMPYNINLKYNVNREQVIVEQEDREYIADEVSVNDIQRFIDDEYSKVEKMSSKFKREYTAENI